MDAELSQNLDEMIADLVNTKNARPKRKELNELDGKPYVRSLRMIKEKISQMADPDVAEIAPSLIDIFEKKKKRIKELDKSQDTKDEILYGLSVQRKLLGIDNKRYKKSDEPSTQRLEIAH